MTTLTTERLSKNDKLDSRILKRNRLLNETRLAGVIGRLQLARAAHISNSRVCDLVQELIEEGALIEEIDVPDRRGRRIVPIRVNPDFGSLIGIDMEARRLRCVVTDFAGQVVWQNQERLPKPKDRQALLDAMEGFISDSMKKIRRRFSRLLGVGIAAFGEIDFSQGVVMRYKQLEAAQDIPVIEMAESVTRLPCFIEDNIRALTVAEWRMGAARSLTDFICLAVRAGVGAGVVVGGKLLTGAHGRAGAAELMTLPVGSRMDRWITLQEEVSDQALGVDLESDGSWVIPDSAAQRAGRVLGAQLATLASLFDPQAIVLAGASMQPQGPLWGPMEKVFRSMVLPEVAEQVLLLPAQLGSYAAAQGGAERCFQELFPVSLSQKQ